MLLLSACGAAPEARPERRPPLVEAVEARQGRLPLQATVNGLVRADNQVAIRPEVAGSVVEVLVRSGDSVGRGQPLVRLQGDELRERLRQAEADVRLAEASLAEARARVVEIEARVRRTRALAAEDLVSVQNLEVAEAQLGALEASAAQAAARVDQARATAEERRSALTKTVVRAPVAGRVGQRQVEVGQRVDSGSVLFLVGNLDEMRVEVPLTEAMLGRVEAGMPVEVVTDEDAVPSGTGPLTARLSRVSPFLAEESFTTVGEIDLDDPPAWLRPGMFVTVRIFYGESAPATLVPASALWEEPASGQQGIFSVLESQGLVAPAEGVSPADLEPDERVRRVVFRPARVLAEGGGEVGVAGLAAGEWVVTLGQQMLWQQAEDATGGEGAEVGEGGSAAREAGSAMARARVRPTSWQRVRQLQELQREDLLEDFLAKQQRVAAALGAEIPASEDEVIRVLKAGEPSDAGSGASAGANAGGPAP
ncbi:MAG: efflux RND transporter periplasmic adaptor subunit [Acidobacteriota bacterium]